MAFAALAGTMVFHSGGTVGRVRVIGGSVSNGAALYRTSSSVTTPVTVSFDGTTITGMSRIAAVYQGSAVTFQVRGVVATGLLNAAFYSSTCPFILEGEKIDGLNTALVQRSAAEALRVNGQQLQVDQTLLTPADGDMIYNNNATPANGVGVALWNAAAAKWKNLYSGVTN